jgi:hypothetical protein
MPQFVQPQLPACAVNCSPNTQQAALRCPVFNQTVTVGVELGDIAAKRRVATLPESITGALDQFVRSFVTVEN